MCLNKIVFLTALFASTYSFGKNNDLVWNEPLHANVSFSEAKSYCEGLPVRADLRPWRLPYAHELIEISLDYDQKNRLADLDNFFWTLTNDPQSSQPILVYPLLSRTMPSASATTTDVICVANYKYPVRGPAGLISIAGTHACAVDEKAGLRCWGNDQYKQNESIRGFDAVQVAAGINHTCALKQTGSATEVQCWGATTESTDWGQTRVPETLMHPRQIGVGEYFSCALDDDRIACWGLAPRPIDHLNHPVQLSVGDRHFCAIDGDGIKCSGIYASSYNNMPNITHPIQVSAGFVHTCALDDNGVKCWGLNQFGETNVPPLNHPRQVSAGYNQTCAIDLDGVHCWGRPLNNLTFLKHDHDDPFIEVNAGEAAACSVTRKGKLNCVVGGAENGLLKNPILLNFSDNFLKSIGAWQKSWEHQNPSNQNTMAPVIPFNQANAARYVDKYTLSIPCMTSLNMSGTRRFEGKWDPVFSNQDGSSGAWIAAPYTRWTECKPPSQR